MADLTITVDIRENQTMSRYALPKNGKLTFANASASGELSVTVKGAGQTPFCEQDGQTPIPVVAVPAGDEKTVRICNDFAGSEFAYTAQIGSAAAEDPIVILEPDKIVSPGMLYMTGGLIVGIAIGYLLATSMLARRSRSTA